MGHLEQYATHTPRFRMSDDPPTDFVHAQHRNSLCHLRAGLPRVSVCPGHTTRFKILAFTAFLVLARGEQELGECLHDAWASVRGQRSSGGSGGGLLVPTAVVADQIALSPFPLFVAVLFPVRRGIAKGAVHAEARYRRIAHQLSNDLLVAVWLFHFFGKLGFVDGPAESGIGRAREVLPVGAKVAVEGRQEMGPVRHVLEMLHVVRQVFHAPQPHSAVEVDLRREDQAGQTDRVACWHGPLAVQQAFVCHVGEDRQLQAGS